MKEQQWLRSLRGEKKEAIYRQILENPTISRMEMAKNLKMRANTVSDLVQELLDDGLVVETRTQPNGMRGRPVHTLKISATRCVCLSIYPEDYHLIGSLMDMAEATMAELSG
ncbi:MAG: winged helix-turn-helix domain-containing protein, partial [Spirochaetia bacterium]|nr:winged helix-turn-helix domain-containing protein [Spirochaetia bacterium]